MVRTLTARISEVSASNSRPILSSRTRDLTVGAPVMPSLKAPVMREFCSRTLRWSTTSFFWNQIDEISRTGTTIITHSASFQSSASIITITQPRYDRFHTPSIMSQAIVPEILSVSDMTRA